MKPLFRTMIARAERQKNGRTRVTASTPTADRYSDIVEASWNLKHFKNNPVVLWGHDYTRPPIGRVVELGLEGSDLVAEIEWDTHESNPLGRTVASQFERGFLNAVSVGFTPGSQVERSSLKEDDPMYGKKGMVHRENELMEISAVSIPAHRDAVAMRGLLGAIGPELQRHILNVEETEEGIVVTYARHESVDDADTEEPIEEGSGYDDEHEEKQVDEEEEEEAEEAADSEDDEEPDDDDDDDDDDDEEAKARFAPRAKHPAHDLMPIVRACVLDLIGSDPAILEPTTNRTDGLATLFGIDK